MADVVILASGGINSGVAAVRGRHAGAVHLMHADFGQVAAAGQRAAVRALADALGAGFTGIELPHVSKLASIPRDGSGRPDVHANPRLDRASGIPGLMPLIISAGVQLGHRLGATAVHSGASEHADEIETEAAPGRGSPDHRRDFFYLYQVMLEQLQRAKSPIRLEAPLIDMSRAEIIKLGHRYNMPFDLTYSCREARDVACGQCGGCSARSRGFKDAGLVDPAMHAASA